MRDVKKRAEELAILLERENALNGHYFWPKLIEQALIAERNMALEEAVKAIEECKSLDWWEEVKEIRALKVKKNE